MGKTFIQYRSPMEAVNVIMLISKNLVHVHALFMFQAVAMEVKSRKDF